MPSPVNQEVIQMDTKGGKKKCKGGECPCENCMKEKVEGIMALGFSNSAAQIWTKYNSQVD